MEVLIRILDLALIGSAAVVLILLLDAVGSFLRVRYGKRPSGPGGPASYKENAEVKVP